MWSTQADAGLVVLLDALATVVTGATPPESTWERPPAGSDRPVHGADPDGPAFEIMYLLEAADLSIPNLREALDGLGDSVVVVGGDGLWNVHVHANDPGAAVEAAVAHGRPFRIRITSLLLPAGEQSGTTRAVVAVVPGRGLAQLFESVGACVVEGGPGARPTPARLLAAIEFTGASEVVLLPNDTDHLAVAEAAADSARADGLRVAVVPSRAPVQGLAALAVHDAASSI